MRISIIDRVFGMKTRAIVNRLRVESAVQRFPFVVACFDFDEPLIVGWGGSREEALRNALSDPECPKGVKVCSRGISSTEIFWQSTTGEIVRPDHFSKETQRTKTSWQ